MAASKRRTSKELIGILASKGGVKADSALAAVAMSTDLDVTDVSSEDLGDFIRQTIQNKYTCVVYPAGDRIMLSVHG